MASFNIEEDLDKILEGVPEAKKKKLEDYNEMIKKYQVTKEQAHQKFIQPTPPVPSVTFSELGLGEDKFTVKIVIEIKEFDKKATQNLLIQILSLNPEKNKFNPGQEGSLSAGMSENKVRTLKKHLYAVDSVDKLINFKDLIINKIPETRGNIMDNPGSAYRITETLESMIPTSEATRILDKEMEENPADDSFWEKLTGQTKKNNVKNSPFNRDF